MANIALGDQRADDKAGKQYWDNEWSSDSEPIAADPTRPGIRNLFVRRFHRMFQDIFDERQTVGSRFLEMGCGSSVWLPYFKKQFEFDITGIDYSMNGTRKAERILQRSGVDGKVINGDFFEPPAELLSSFDFVYSSGVAEHFIPTEKYLFASSNFLAPGGLMITIIPNLTGVIGILMRILNRPVYDIHVLIDVPRLRQAHESVGLKVLDCKYVLSSGFGVANVNGLPNELFSTKLKRAIFKFLERLSIAIWLAEDRLFQLPTSKYFSPYLICIAEKPSTVN